MYAKIAQYNYKDKKSTLKKECFSVIPAGAAVLDSMRTFRWRDPWVTVEGLIERDSVACRVESIDTLRQVVHRVPRRFLFIRWGTKTIRQEVVSSNPHTNIIYTEYIEFKKKKR